jgi:2-dehydro-3-deoxygalactonokinase
MISFLSCDWGTSSFRLRLVDAATLRFSFIENPDHGILKTFERWQQSGEGEADRFTFYWQVIRHGLKTLEQQTSQSLQHIPLVISGMATSSIGMKEMKYRNIPAFADGQDFEIQQVNAADEPGRKIFFISGLRSDDDVMRGEETQLAGCRQDQQQERIFIFPGTHSKHVLVENGRITHIKTFMTGEFFSLLSTNSVLASSIQSGGDPESAENKKAFQDGVKTGYRANLLHTAFIIRTNQLLKKLSALENYFYLSGLLIGTELADLKVKPRKPITLVANGEIMNLYKDALKNSGLADNETFLQTEDADEALIRGQLNILKRITLQ